MISFDEYLVRKPRIEYFPEYDATGEYDGNVFEGIKALTYDGADYKGCHTKIFAHMGFPENVKEPVPAVVLVHGGGGHPEDVWIKKWNSRGYAAISMDVTGQFPTKPVPHLYETFAEGLGHKLVEPFAQEGYIAGPANSEMHDMHLPVEDQWMYQAVAAVILAHNILRNDPKIDNSRIGICGISWGGVITSIVIGYDLRFAFAVPIYGSGYLGSGLSQLDRTFKRPGAQQWYAENRFKDVKIPVMWLCWNDDVCFSINSNTMSYMDTKGNNPNTCLSMVHEMDHSHVHGYTPEESYWFANMVLSGNQIPRVEARYTKDSVSYFCDEKVKAVRLFYITEEMRYAKRKKYSYDNFFMEQDWQIVDLDPEKDLAELPQNAVGKYVEFTLENGIVLTAPYLE